MMMDHAGRFSLVYQAPDTPGSPEEDERIEVDPEDDETSNEPTDETGDDEGEDEAGADESDGVDVAPEPRGRRQFGELRETNRELARQNADLTRKFAELEGRVNGQQYQQPPQETPQQRQSRLSLLSPEERFQVELQERDQFYARQNNQLMGMVQDSGDRASFSALTTSNKVARRFSNEVERRHNEYKAKGAFVERRIILQQILGERVLAQEENGTPQRRAAANRQRQRGKPASAGSDVRPARSRTTTGSAEDYETRFGDVQI
jgi:hypothetical protein